MNSRHRSELYRQDDREEAAVIIELCKDKPIRKMGPMDYSAGQIPKAPRGYTPKRTAKENADDARRKLGERCVALLRERGAMTTSEIARELGSNSKAVAAALGDVPTVLRDSAKAAKKNKNGSYSSCALWMMPVRDWRAKESQTSSSIS